MSDSGLGDVFDAFEGSDVTDAARPGQPITEPDPNLQFVDTVTDLEEGIATPEKMLFDTAYGMEKLAELRAGGRPLPDLAAQGATELFDGSATDVWDKMRPENASPIDDAAGRLAVASEQLAGTTLGGIAPGGAARQVGSEAYEQGREVLDDYEHRPPPSEGGSYDEDAMVAPPSASYTGSETRPDPDDVPYVDGLATIGKEVIEAESEMNPIQGMGEVAHEMWTETEDMAAGRSIPDMAARGEDLVLNGDPHEVWDQIKPDPVPGVPESTTDMAGRAALESIQLGTDVGANVMPGGMFHEAMDAIDAVQGPTPDPGSQFSPLPKPGAEGDADGYPEDDPGNTTPPLHEIEATDAVDDVMGDVIAPAPEPEPAPEAPMVLTSPDLDSDFDVSAPAVLETVLPDVPDLPDISASFDSMTSDDGGGWGTSTDTSYDEGF